MKCCHALFFTLLLVPAAGASAASSSENHARTIYLVRHGDYDMSAKDSNEDGPGLTALGVAQARLLAARLRGLPVQLTTVLSSTMARAQDTARVIHESVPEVPVRFTPLLRECTPPRAKADTPAGPAQEAAITCQQQLDDAFAAFFVPAVGADQSDILVCHGNVIRYFVAKALGADTRIWTAMDVAHASLTVIRITPRGNYVVLSIGDVGHIPPNLQSGAGPVAPALLAPKPVTVP